MFYFFRLLTTMTCILLATFSSGTHIIGGEMFYQYIGNNEYKITIKLYRDCGPTVQAAFPDPLHLAIYDSNDVLFIQEDIQFPGATVIQPNPMPVGASDLCVQESIYETSVILPPIPGGYKIIYSICCRNLTINNILTSGNDVGVTLLSIIPDTTNLGFNNEPYFDQTPPMIICANMPFSFDHSATDPDGDMLRYHLCELLDGSYGEAEPSPPLPTYEIISNYQSPYSYSDPMGGIPPMTIDSLTGLLTVTTNALGTFAVGVCVSEYRDGELIGEHRRDYSIHVVDSCLINTIERSSFRYLTIYPNPVSDYIMINGADDMTSINIINTIGQIVVSSNLPSGNRIDVSSLQSGYYLVEIKNDESTHRYRFLKQ